MVVPGPRGRDHEIARPHRGPLAVDRGVGALAFDDEAQRALGVAMAGRDLARQDELQAGEERMRDARGRVLTQRRVLQNQHATLGLGRGDQTSRFHQHRADFVVVPQRRGLGRTRLDGLDSLQHLPQRSEAAGRDPGVKSITLGGVSRLGRHGCVTSPVSWHYRDKIIAIGANMRVQ